MFDNNPQLRYPIQETLLAARDQRKPLALSKEKVLKSRIRDRVSDEKEEMDYLLQRCEALLQKYNFSIAEGKLRNHNQVTTRDHVYHTFVNEYNSFARTEGSAQEDAARLHKNPAWQAYTQYIQVHPMRCEGHIRKLIGEILQLQKSIDMQYTNIEKGEVGEEIVADYLRLFEGKYIVKNNVMLNSRTSSRAETAESDFCVITDKGIFVGEIKNIGNFHKRIHIGKDGRWEIVDKSNGHRDVKKQSPAAQNVIHCLEIESFLREKGLPNIPVIPVIIIANNAVDIENDGTNYVIRKEELYNIIRCDPSPSCLDMGTMQYISYLLDCEHVEERAFDVETLGDLPEKILNLLFRYLTDYNRELQWNQALAEYVCREIEKNAPAIETEYRKNHGNTKLLNVLTFIVTIVLTLLGITLIADSLDMIFSNRAVFVNARPIASFTLMIAWTAYCRFSGLSSPWAANRTLPMYLAVLIALPLLLTVPYSWIVKLLRIPTLVIYILTNVAAVVSLFKKIK